MVQSNTGLKPSEVAVVARKHFPVRECLDEPVPASWESGRSKLGEQLRRRVATRGAAGCSRLRRGSRGRRRAPRGAMQPNSVRDGGERLAPGGLGGTRGLREGVAPGGVRKLLVGEENSLAERMSASTLEGDFASLSPLGRMPGRRHGRNRAVWWSRAPVVPRPRDVVNLYEAGEDCPGVTWIAGDALVADELLRGEELGLAFSNSLIEHVGGHGPRRRLAEAVVSLAPAYLVQTPYRYFPVEPNWMFPGSAPLRVCPVVSRAALAGRPHLRGGRAGTRRTRSRRRSSYLPRRCREYYKDAEIVSKRQLAGVPKSMTAIKPPGEWRRCSRPLRSRIAPAGYAGASPCARARRSIRRRCGRCGSRSAREAVPEVAAADRDLAVLAKDRGLGVTDAQQVENLPFTDDPAEPANT